MQDTLIIAMAGLPASGKSALGRALQKTLQAALLDKDEVRACLFAERVDYSREQNDLCVNVQYDVAHYLLGNDRKSGASPPPVILDGRTYLRRYQINALKAAASRSASRLCIIECVCTEQTARERLEQDKDIHPAKDRDFELYLECRAYAEEIVEPKLVVQTDTHALQQCVEIVEQYLRSQ